MMRKFVLGFVFGFALGGSAEAQLSPNPMAIPTGTPGVVVPQPLGLGIRYQVQGTGFACVSWADANVGISGTGANSKCSGRGAFLVTAGSAENRLPQAPTGTGAPQRPLWGVAAAGADLQVSYE